MGEVAGSESGFRQLGCAGAAGSGNGGEGNGIPQGVDPVAGGGGSDDGLPLTQIVGMGDHLPGGDIRIGIGSEGAGAELGRALLQRQQNARIDGVGSQLFAGRLTCGGVIPWQGDGAIEGIQTGDFRQIDMGIGFPTLRGCWRDDPCQDHDENKRPAGSSSQACA